MVFSSFSSKILRESTEHDLVDIDFVMDNEGIYKIKDDKAYVISFPHYDFCCAIYVDKYGLCECVDYDSWSDEGKVFHKVEEARVVVSVE